MKLYKLKCYNFAQWKFFCMRYTGMFPREIFASFKFITVKFKFSWDFMRIFRIMRIKYDIFDACDIFGMFSCEILTLFKYSTVKFKNLGSLIKNIHITCMQNFLKFWDTKICGNLSQTHVFQRKLQSYFNKVSTTWVNRRYSRGHEQFSC